MMTLKQKRKARLERKERGESGPTRTEPVPFEDRSRQKVKQMEANAAKRARQGR